MKRLSILICMLVLAGCLPQRQEAQPRLVADDYEAYDRHIKPLVDFIHANSEMGRSGLAEWRVRNSVITADKSILSKKAKTSFGRDVQLIAATTVVKQTAGANVSYFPIIILDAERFIFSDPFQVSGLLHELVHFAQLELIIQSLEPDPYGNTRFDDLAKTMGWECDRSLEREAYRVQNLWLAKNYAHRVISAAHIADVSRCTEPVQSAAAIVIEVPELAH